MKVREWVRIAFIGIWGNKTRSILAILSIFIGIGAIVSLISIGNGTKKQVLNLLEELGINTIDIYSEYDPNTNQKGRITLEDARAIERLPIVESSKPRINIEKIVTKGKVKDKVSIHGVTSSDFFHGEGCVLIMGRLINNLDIKLQHHVCIIGKDISETFFKEENPIGKVIRIGREKFVVVGVMAWRHIGVMTIGGWVGDAIFIPYNIAIRIAEKDKKEVIDFLQVRFIPSISVEEASSFIINFLKKRHQNRGKYNAESSEEFIKTYTQINQTLTLVGVAIACISLLVGGIGIMNMMLTAVLERRKEIGIRKAIGARGKDIMGQFLIEAVTISTIGGCLGIGGGILLANIASIFIKIPTVISLNSIILAVSFSLGIGMFSGIYPAYKASNLDPIVALRYE
ncbi:MAG: ABC transporter permease [bacterium]